METEVKETIINLQDLFAMNNEYLVKFLKERCFDRLNEFLKAKSGVANEPLFIRIERNDVKIGYVPRDTTKTKFFSNESMRAYGDDAMSKAILVQYVIFEGCKEYGCFKDVPMCGAPEEGGDAFFTFTHEEVPYRYLIWTK
jgi:hypothetical protein